MKQWKPKRMFRMTVKYRTRLKSDNWTGSRVMVKTIHTASYHQFMITYADNRRPNRAPICDFPSFGWFLFPRSKIGSVGAKFINMYEIVQGTCLFWKQLIHFAWLNIIVITLREYYFKAASHLSVCKLACQRLLKYSCRGHDMSTSPIYLRFITWFIERVALAC